MSLNKLKNGYTTGTCAAAAAKAAAMVLTGKAMMDLTEVTIRLPDDEVIAMPLAHVRQEGAAVTVAVTKDAGDDPDATHGALVQATLHFRPDDEITFVAGEGVGTVTRPGLAVAVGEPAINPVPRRMIRAAVREVTDRGVQVELAIPGGLDLAQKTFNERLGIRGGLSILGTSGRVRPFSHAAVQATVACALDVAQAGGIRQLVLVPGRIGARAAQRHLRIVTEQIVEVSNEWGFALEKLSGRGFEQVLLVGHPGKLAKLAAGNFETHSSRSPNATAYLTRFGAEVLGRRLPDDYLTTEALMLALQSGERSRLAAALARKISDAAQARIGLHPPVSVLLVNLQGDELGTYGDLLPWR